jgi:hypothetical protein
LGSAAALLCCLFRLFAESTAALIAFANKTIDNVRAELPTLPQLATAREAAVADARARVGGLCPEVGPPRNPWETVLRNTLDLSPIGPVITVPAVHEINAFLSSKGGMLRVVLLGPSGCGKTYAICQLAAMQCVLFLDFSTSKCATSDLDVGSSLLVGSPLCNEFVEQARAYASSLPGPTSNFNAPDLQILVQRLIVAKLLLLATAVDVYGALSPSDMFWIQRTTWGQQHEKQFYLLLTRSNASLDVLCRIHHILRKRLSLAKFVVAIDEAMVAGKLLGGRFRSALRSSTAAAADRALRDEPRGLLGVLLYQLASPETPVICAGTSTHLRNYESVGSSHGKFQGEILRVTKFPSFTVENTSAFLDACLVLPATVKSSVADTLRGKGRYAETFVNEVYLNGVKRDIDVTAVAMRVRRSLVSKAVERLQTLFPVGKKLCVVL